MNRPGIKSLFACGAILFLTHAAVAQCPPACTEGPETGCPISVGSGACTYESFLDKKGGLWCYVCTNVNGGDYEWWYDEAGAKPRKIIGRCVFKGGMNNHGYIIDPNNPRQREAYWHYVIDGNNSKHVVIHIFFKEPNNGVEIEVRYNNDTDEWDEVRRTPYESLPDNPSPLPRPADGSKKLGLLASNIADNPAAVSFKWSTPDPLPIPVLTPGDSVFIGDVAPSDILSVDPRFNISTLPPPGPAGIVLTAIEDVPLFVGDVLVITHRPSPPTVLYGVHDVGAMNFYMGVLNGGPLGPAWSTRVDLADMVGYVAASGDIAIPGAPNGVPAVSEIGLGIIGALVIGMGAYVLRGRGLAAPGQ